MEFTVCACRRRQGW